MTAPPPQAWPAPSAAAREQVQAAAAACHDLVQVAARTRTCTACPELAATRTSVVPGEVPPTARLLLLGEAPGASEDATGRPFVGRSGQLLDQLLREVGAERAEVGVLNTLKCRPPGNRPPSRAESAACRAWTQRQLDLAQPRVVVALGLSATRWFLGPVTLAAVRGRLHPRGAAGAASADGGTGPGTAPTDAPPAVLPTYHPSAALRFGPAGEPRRLLREDLARAVQACR